MLHPMFVIRKLWALVDTNRNKCEVSDANWKKSDSIVCLRQDKSRGFSNFKEDLSPLNLFSVVVTFLRVILFIIAWKLSV
jgi:hypothetical protein